MPVSLSFFLSQTQTQRRTGRTWRRMDREEDGWTDDGKENREEDSVEDGERGQGGG